MKKLQLLILFLGTLVYGQRPVDLVNPLVDSANSRWFFFSSATRPFGMVNLSPDMGTAGAWESGYRYNQKTIFLVIFMLGNCLVSPFYLLLAKLKPIEDPKPMVLLTLTKEKL